MKNVTERLFIFSVFQSGNTSEVNRAIHDNLFKSLIANNRFPFQVKGRYLGSDELSIGVWGDNNWESIVGDICNTHKQECYLVVYTNQGNRAELVYNNGSRKDIGVLTKVSHVEAINSDSYSEIDGSYYIVKDKS